MARPLRIEFAGAIDHVRARGNAHDRVRMLPDRTSSIGRATAFVHPNVILTKIARKYGVDPDRLTNPKERARDARNIAIWMVAELCGLKLREIGELFGGIDYAAVAECIRRVRISYSEKNTRALIAEILNV
jgi:chromosomal replication initiation ATPase DnaA